MKTAEGMRVVEGRIYLVEISGRRAVLLELETEGGLAGCGEAGISYGQGATAAAAMIEELLEAYVLGEDGSRISALCRRIWADAFWTKGGGPIIGAGVSAIEQALWDIKGKALGAPVCELLGGKCREKVRAYANGWSFHCHEPTEYVREATRVVEDGFTALKLYPLALRRKPTPESGLRHPRREEVTREVEHLAVARVAAVREAVGPEVEVMIDISAVTTPDMIIRICRRIEEYDISFVEEPVDPQDVEALMLVREKTQIPIAVGERLYRLGGFRRVLELHAADILQPDLGYCGGILEARHLAAAAEARSMRIQAHVVSASPVSTVVALQFEAAITNFYMHEHYYREAAHRELARPAPGLKAEGGYVPVPEGAGLGVELDRERLAPFLRARCRAG